MQEEGEEKKKGRGMWSQFGIMEIKHNMKRLIAEFSIRLPGFVLLSGPKNGLFNGRAKIDNFDIEVILYPFAEGISMRKVGEDFETFGSLDVKVVVARDEMTPPPTYNDLQLDRSAQIEYFHQRLEEYQLVAIRVINRTIGFFKFKLDTPLLYYVERFSQDSLYNPKWFDENGNEIANTIKSLIFKPIPGVTDFPNHIKPLQSNNLSEFQDALNNPIIPELYEEVLSDAHDAIYQDNLRRSVVEMAIATEIFVKQIFFGKDKLANSVIDYWEDSGRLNVRVLELIDKIAKRCFKSSFKDDYPNEFKNIDHLFRCRNKAVHHGKLEFSDDSAKTYEVDRLLLNQWLESVSVLRGWLLSKNA